MTAASALVHISGPIVSLVDKAELCTPAMNRASETDRAMAMMPRAIMISVSVKPARGMGVLPMRVGAVSAPV